MTPYENIYDTYEDTYETIAAELEEAVWFAQKLRNTIMAEQSMTVVDMLHEVLYKVGTEILELEDTLFQLEFEHHGL